MKERQFLFGYYNPLHMKTYWFGKARRRCSDIDTAIRHTRWEIMDIKDSMIKAKEAGAVQAITESLKHREFSWVIREVHNV